MQIMFKDILSHFEKKNEYGFVIEYNKLNDIYLSVKISIKKSYSYLYLEDHMVIFYRYAYYIFSGYKYYLFGNFRIYEFE